jgi:5-(carboxyamino)imidazole ribonucleotide synthase
MIKKKKKIIGILGGGQLGQMLSDAAIKLGYNTHIYSPDINSPACKNSTHHTIGQFEDQENINEFINNVDLITIEFENIPLSTIEYISGLKQIYPPPSAIKISQDRLLEKNFFIENKIKTNNYMNVESIKDLSRWNFDKKSVLKTRKFGYDGKGQKIINSYDEAKDAFINFKNYPCLIEEFIEYTKEVSTISARDIHGNIYSYHASENIHKNHILDRSFAPAHIDETLDMELKKISSKIISQLEYIGILSIEFFVRINHQTNQEELIANEIAPRVHNSGHWTLDGADVSQFTQHIRAIMGLEISEPQLIFTTEMYNIIGDDIHHWSNIKSTENKKIYIYGKDEPRKGRKMGHVNFISRN